MKTVTVVCPVYNEEAVIELFYREVKNVLNGLTDLYQSRILFVVDRGQDATDTQQSRKRFARRGPQRTDPAW